MELIKSEGSNQEIIKVVHDLLEEYSNDEDEIIGVIKEVFPELKDKDVNDIIRQAYELKDGGHFIQPEIVIPLHVARYNKTVERLLKIPDPLDLDKDVIDKMDMNTFWAMRKKKILAMNDLINTLIQKEELLQYHNKDFIIEINNEEEVEINETKPKLDIGLLTFDEQVELLQLMTKAKSEVELQSVILHDQTNETIDADYREINEEIPNINMIQHEELPSEVVNVSSSIDPKLRIIDTANKEAIKAFKGAGGNLDDREKSIADEKV